MTVIIMCKSVHSISRALGTRSCSYSSGNVLGRPRSDGNVNATYLWQAPVEGSHHSRSNIVMKGDNVKAMTITQSVRTVQCRKILVSDSEKSYHYLWANQ